MGNRPAIIPTLFGILFVASVDNQLLMPLLPLLSREFHTSIHSLSWLFSLYALSAALFNLLLGPLTDRFGRVLFLKIGLFLFGLLALSTYFTGSFAQLLLVRSGAGLAAGLLSNCTAGFIGDFFPYRQRGRVMGIVLSSYFAALIFGIPISSWLAQTWDWRLLFVISAVVAALLLAMVFLWFPPNKTHPETTLRGNLSIYKELLVRSDTRAAALVSFAVSGATLALLTFLSGYLDAAFGLTPLQISWLFVSAGAAAVFASPLSGWLSDRWNKRGVFLAANTVLVVPLLLLDRVAWGWPLITLFFGISLCIAFRQTSLYTLQTQLIGGESRGSFLALRNGFSQFGISISVFAGGIAYARFGYRAIILLACFLSLAASLLFYRKVPEPRSGGREEKRHAKD